MHLNSIELFNSLIQESIDVKSSILRDPQFNLLFNSICEICITCFKNKGKLLIAGNGGSAADAQHLAGEMVSRFNFDRSPLSAFALTTDTSIITAVGNDYGFEDIFSRQILAHGNTNDVFIAISTSGHSKNILKAIYAAKNLGLPVIGFTGISGGEMKKLCDFCICVPSSSTPRIQECHLLLEHALCEFIENALFLN
jgi:D-sedoheptulose 7-phosphate isomerase